MSFDHTFSTSASMREFSDVAHRVKLQAQCNSYRQLISKIASGKENFVVDLVKALRKVTDEWKNWKHQSYGKLQTKVYVSAIEQVKELLVWHRRAYHSSTVSRHRSSAGSYRQFTIDTLHNFLQTCKEMERLRLIFQSQILAHLKEYMNGDKETEKYVIRLELVLMHWKLLLSPGTINVSHYSMGSDVLLRQVELQEGFRNFYPVLRLIPDLCFKAEQCMELVQHCLYRDSLRGYQREREFLLNVWLPKRKQLEKNNSSPDEALTNTVIDLQLSSELIKALDQEITENNKTLSTLKQERSKLEKNLNEIVQDQRKSEEMLEPLGRQETDSQKKIAKILSRKAELSNSISKNKSYLQKCYFFDTEDNDKRREDLVKDITLNNALNEQIKALKMEVDDTRSKTESIKNKVASQNWFIRKITNKLNETINKIHKITRQQNDLKVEHRSLDLKRKVNIAKMHRLNDSNESSLKRR